MERSVWKQHETVRETWARILTSESRKIPKSRTTVDGVLVGLIIKLPELYDMSNSLFLMKIEHHLQTKLTPCVDSMIELG